MSFGLLSKEQVQFKGYHPLKSVLTTFPPHFNVIILPFQRKGFYLSGVIEYF